LTTLAFAETRARQFFALAKPRVVSLIVFTAVIGMFLAAPGIPPAEPVLFGTIGIALVAGAAAAINCLIEQNIDKLMRRTSWRPSFWSNALITTFLLLGPANEPASLVIRRCLVGEVKRVRIDPPKAKRSRYAAMTRAGRLVGHEATVRPSKRFDRRTGVLQALTKQLRRYRKGLGALRAGEIKNVAEDVRQTIRQAAPPTLIRVREFDRYQGKGIPEGKVSLSLRLTFRSPDRTLTDAEVQKAMDDVLTALRGRYDAVQR